MKCSEDKIPNKTVLYNHLKENWKIFQQSQEVKSVEFKFFKEIIINVIYRGNSLHQRRVETIKMNKFIVKGTFKKSMAKMKRVKRI